MAQDLRCESKKHGVLIDSNTLEIKCDSRFCGAKRGVVVLHWFDVQTGAMIKTMQYKNPIKKGKQ